MNLKHNASLQILGIKTKFFIKKLFFKLIVNITNKNNQKYGLINNIFL